MINRKLFLILVFLLSNYVSEAQNKIKQPINNTFSCVLNHGNNLSKSGDYLHVNTFPFINNNSYCIKVYVNKITRKDFTGGISNGVLMSQIDNLNSYFNGTGISFVWDDNILEVNNDAIYDTSALIGNSSTNPVNWNALSDYTHDDGIDLFFLDQNFYPFGQSTPASTAHKLAYQTEVIFTLGHASTAAIAHEIGHVLGLFHTYHSTIGLGNDSNYENNDGFIGHLEECANGSNKYSSGDYVGDTVADRGGEFTQFVGCTVTPTSVTDGANNCSDIPYDPAQITNFMNMINPLAQSCANNFTPLQVRRMKYFIQTRLVLQNAIAPSCTAPACNAFACDMDAEIDATTDNENCKVYLNGINTGVYCPDQTYEWSVRKLPSSTYQVVSNDEDFLFTPTDFFPDGSGTYEFKFKIIYDTGRDECYDESDIQTVTITCDPPPTCPVSSCLNIVTPPDPNCLDVQAWMNCNDPDIDHIKWYYTIGNYNHVYAGTSYGNPAGQHSYPIYLPPPPMPQGSWNNYVLRVYAETYFDDGNGGFIVCDEVSTSLRMTCSSGGGPQFSINLYPNPSKSGNELQFSGLDAKEVNSIEILDLFGSVKTTVRPKGKSFNVGKLSSGIYFVKFYTSKGIVEKKLIIE